MFFVYLVSVFLSFILASHIRDLNREEIKKWTDNKDKYVIYVLLLSVFIWPIALIIAMIMIIMDMISELLDDIKEMIKDIFSL